MADKDFCVLQEETCPHATRAAEAAVKKVFAILGVNVSEPKEVEAFRENLRFGANMRRRADRIGMAMAAAIGTAILAALWAGVQALLKGH